jgi:hypothetical protein
MVCCLWLLRDLSQFIDFDALKISEVQINE